LSPQAGAAQLAAFCALVLEDVALQQALRRCAGTDAFVAAFLDAARQRGFVLSAEDVHCATRAREYGIARSLDAEVTATHPPPDGWLPIVASWHGDELYADWAYFGERHLHAPFFAGDVSNCLLNPFSRLVRCATLIETIAAWLETQPHLQPNGFIFHMSRCGSTSLSQMLAAPPSNIVVSEADPIDTVVQARLRRPDLSQDRQARWLTSIVGALGQKRRGHERAYFIKLDSWHSQELPLFRRAFPAVPWLFLYRHPIEVLVSHLRVPGAQMLPDGIGAKLYGLERSYGPGYAEDYYARVLAKIIEPVVQHYRQGGGLLVNYRELPQALFATILPHFGVACDEADRAAMTEAARYDAKTPGLAFASDSEAKQHRATEATHAAAARWLDDPYRRLEALRAGRVC
jgi:hypothetical protein